MALVEGHVALALAFSAHWWRRRPYLDPDDCDSEALRVLLRAARCFDEGRGVPFPPYLRRSLKRALGQLAALTLRRRLERPREDGVELVPDTRRPGPGDAAELADELARVAGALRFLDARDREAVTTGRVRGVSPGRAWQIRNRGLGRLAKVLGVPGPIKWPGARTGPSPRPTKEAGA